MNIERRRIAEVGSCNLCSRGVYHGTAESLTNFPSLVYPYSDVTVISYGVEVRVCDDCMGEIIKNYKKK